MNTWIIGLIGQERGFNRRSIGLWLLYIFACSCGVSSISSQNTLYYYDKEKKVRIYEQVDTPPFYNDEIWQIGLSKEFNKKFKYEFEEDESIITTIIAEIILDKNGVIVSSRLLQNEGTVFGEKVLTVLRGCDKWSPGRVNGQAVYTKLIWKAVY